MLQLDNAAARVLLPFLMLRPTLLLSQSHMLSAESWVLQAVDADARKSDI
jgi:hypothetical protein